MLDIRNPRFARYYRAGLLRRIFGGPGCCGPLTDTELVELFKRGVREGLFDGGHDEQLPALGYYLGMVHGGVLTPDGALRRDVSTLIVMSHPDCQRGYCRGREWFFTDATPGERLDSDEEFIELLRTFACEEAEAFEDEDDSLIYWFVGSTLGCMSGLVFPQIGREGLRSA